MQLLGNDVAVEPLKSRDLSEASVISAIEEMNRTYDVKKKNAVELSQKIQKEGGVKEAVRLIKEIETLNEISRG